MARIKNVLLSFALLVACQFSIAQGQTIPTPANSVDSGARSVISITGGVLPSLGGGGGSGTMCGQVSQTKAGEFKNNVKCQGQYIYNQILRTTYYYNPKFTRVYQGYIGPQDIFSYTSICYKDVNVQTGATTACPPGGVLPIDLAKCNMATIYGMLVGYSDCVSPYAAPIYSIGYYAYIQRPNVSNQVISPLMMQMSVSTNKFNCPAGYTFSPVSEVFSTAPGNANATVLLHSCI